MNPSDRRLEIFAPFGEAFDLTKKICFQPFDLGKWFVIGFAAWLATFFSGGSYSWRNRLSKGDWQWHAQHQGAPYTWHNAAPWVIPVVLVAVLFALAFLVLILWLNARGRFMFTDCIVRNRGAIAEPWREYRTEANSLFVFQLVVTLCSLIGFGTLALFFAFLMYRANPIMPMALLVFLGVCWFLLVVLFSLITRFMVPVMYRQRCGALAAFNTVAALVRAHLGLFILFLLFYFLLWIAALAVGCVAGCVTCCLAALPYLGTVILLPVVMTLFAFPLCFIRQFGDAYDVWTVLPPPTEPPPPQMPPVQETLPPL